MNLSSQFAASRLVQRSRRAPRSYLLYAARIEPEHSEEYKPMGIRQSLWAGIAAATTTTLLATTVTPPPLSERDKGVVSETAVQLSAAYTQFPSAATPPADPAQLSEGLHLIAAVSASTVDQRAAAMSAVDAPDGFAAADDLLGDGSLPRELLELYVTGGPSAVVAYVSLALSDAIFGENSIPSQILGEYFDGGPQAVVAYTTLALSDAVFGEDSFASGLVTAWFYGYPFDDDDAQGAYAGVVHYVIDTIVALQENSESPADAEPDDQSDTTAGEEMGDEETPVADAADTPALEGPNPDRLTFEQASPGEATVDDESSDAQAPEVHIADIDAISDDGSSHSTDDATSDEAEAPDSVEGVGGVGGVGEGAQPDGEEADPDSSDAESVDDEAADDEASDDEASDDEAEASPDHDSDDNDDRERPRESEKSDKASRDTGSDTSDSGDSE
ncbi:hypothetical protein ACEWX3_10545 [Mycobacterium sp. G7A2]|uniref:hypothetical protein n=1 Tax=Mycobacterium sp. G7A2 TaxID=3317307 RepID=UPI0035A8ED05